MNDWQKTGIFLGVAVVLGALALLTGGRTQPDLQQFSDQGEEFYPGFTDPNAAASLEVIEYDAESGTAKPFKVQVKDGVWTIPSHYNYPADGEDRLAETAAGIIGLEKDVVQSDRTQDHQALGVLDPLDETVATLEGRGTRVTMRDSSGSVLADFIIGDEVEGKQGFRYVRIPEKKRTYAVDMDVDISTRFADWIETNLLDVTSSDINRIAIQDYSVDEATGRVNSLGSITLQKQDNEWTMAEIPEDKELQRGKISTMTSALSRLTITGVRPKPEGLTADLRTEEGLSMDLPTQLSLQSKGYFVSRDGRLLSNEGEVTAGTKEGVSYTLRFGEVIIGEGLEISAGIEADGEDDAESAEEQAGGTENRYLFVTAQFNESLLPPKPEAPEGYTPEDPAAAEGEEAEPRDPAFVQYEQDLDEWERQVEEGREKAMRMNDRFAPWYYVISASDFGNIRLGRDDLLRDKPVEETPEPAPAPTTPPAVDPDGQPDDEVPDEDPPAETDPPPPAS